MSHPCEASRRLPSVSISQFFQTESLLSAYERTQQSVTANILTYVSFPKGNPHRLCGLPSAGSTCTGKLTDLAMKHMA
jgi:hypothetical protein